MPPLKRPWKKRRAQEAEKKAMKELEREMKEARDKEKEVYISMLPNVVVCVSLYPGCKEEA